MTDRYILPVALRTERPELTFRYNPRLAVRAAWRLEITGVLPAPEEVASVDELWERDVFTALEWIRFHQDWHKRSPDLK